MQDEHRKAIQNNFGSLVEQTDLDVVVSALYEKGVFSEAMIEPYRDTSKDQRNRKRQLYRDIERRGPTAFANLLEALTENGYWPLVRALDPSSHLHMTERERRKIVPSMPADPHKFVSISTTRRENIKPELPKTPVEGTPQPFPLDFRPREDDNLLEVPNFHVVKSEKFHEEDSGISLYRTRSRARGVLLAFSFIEFMHNIEEDRLGAEVDCRNLKYLFNEMGFKTLPYNNLLKEEMEDTLDSLKNVAEFSKVECVFVVISSHGYGRDNTSDTEIRCSDGKIISAMHILEKFNHRNLPQLKDKPKVFVFQTCRGSSCEYILRPPARMRRPGERSSFDGASRFAEPREPEPARAQPEDQRPGEEDDVTIERLYSDMLIAHSTLPGFVSRRDPEQGSWYIQALCDVFARHAHDCHVDTLFTMVDIELKKRFKAQTSSIDKWGFNKLLYLHPGLFEDKDSQSKSPKYSD